MLALVYFVSHSFFASNTAHVSATYAAFLATVIAPGIPVLLAVLMLGILSSLFGGLTQYGSGGAATAMLCRVGKRTWPGRRGKSRS